jgi:phosphohistidine phosphatase
MLRLLLMRHAKSSWADPAAADYDRPLAPRGEAAAPAMGRHMRASNLAPARVLCSGARRTRQTLVHVIAALGGEPEVVYADALYGAGAEAALALVRADGDGASPLLVVGHNPALHELALGLAATGDAASLAALRAKMSTGALAVIDFAAGGWADIGWNAGHLAAFVRPRDLA